MNVAMLWLVFFISVVSLCKDKGFELNPTTCSKKQNINVEVIELDCPFMGKGMYYYEGPHNLKRIKFEKITSKTWIYISDDYLVDSVDIKEGSAGLCSHVITTIPGTSISIDGVKCVSVIFQYLTNSMYMY